jgi:hypothetical protein
VGGPIIRTKLHFFASQEFNKEKRGTALGVHCPAERQGDFSGPRRPRLHAVRAARPETGAPFPATASRPTG